MKRTKLAFLVLSAMLIVTGCKEKEQDLLNKDDPVTIEVWHYYNGAQQDEFNRLVREFNKTVGKEKGIVVWNDQVKNPVAVRYGFRSWIKGELYSTEGIPVPSFRTDNWNVE